eukprot:CAMPEP_0181094770 /NCGR_PEP_ID=MMETSP1071-20121207/10167_1 /TAXON_ID=35127 /ORGANISM="Thalassiosira sp., Strain NH16" /LENGTH=197 /DNA_ID=CAMNT_0023177115 /DNA_START=103 /DNA_END=696 /DNA_ORIENTATION=-
MPPYVEVDTHHDEDCWRPARPPLVLSNDQPSPLFLDYDSITAAKSSPSAVSLSPQQSNPEFSAVVLREDPAKKAAAAAPVVSVITAIIGPESAYVRNTCGGAASTNFPAAASSTASSKRQRPAEPSSSPTSSNNKPSSSSSPANGSNTKKWKTEKPMLLRATRYVSKKGWKVVKSLPNRLATTAGSVRVPGRHRNVV